MKNKGITWKFVKEVKNSKAYSKLTLLDNGVNRGLTKSHVDSIKESMALLGNASVLVVVETKAFGRKILAIVDGQNRYTAAMQLGLPIDYKIFKLDEDTPLNVTKVISTLNTTAKAWSPPNFLNAFVKNDKPNYIKFDSIKRAHGFTITDLLFIYLGGGGAAENRAFKSGEMTFIDEEDSDRLLKAMILIKPHVPNKAMVRRVLPKVFSKAEGDYMGLAKKIKAESLVLERMGMEFSSDQKQFEKSMSAILKSFKEEKKIKAEKKAS